MIRFFFYILFLNFPFATLLGQQITGTTYTVEGHKPMYFPMGKISFADSLVSYKVGSPAPIAKYRDSIQCLHEPDYVGYRTPTFVSLGCEGELIVKFTNNGFMNLPGDDLYIYEVGPSRESARVEISEDGKNWIYAGTIDGGKSALDLSDENIDTETIFYYVKIIDLKDLCENSMSAGADIDAIGAINSVIRLEIASDVLFDIGKYNLKAMALKNLDSLAQKIQILNKATIVIEGHTDSDGGSRLNMELSKNRATAVKEKLEERFGPEAGYDFEIRYYGKERPRVPNTTRRNKYLNRRVEITVQPPKEYYSRIEN